MKAPAILLALAVALSCASRAGAALSESDLSDVSLRPAIGAIVPADIPFVDDDGRSIALGDVIGGRATLLILADFDCRILCGPILAQAATSILSSGLVVGRDFNLVVVGIDPSETRFDAARMRSAQFGDEPRLAAAHFLNGDASAIERLSSALSYRAHYDAATRLYAHPTDMLVLTADRRVSRLLPGLAIDSDGLRFALVEAGAGLIASLIDRAHVLCYGLDPAHGVYDAAVRTTLIGAGGATLAAVGFVILMAQRRRRRLLSGGRP
jgi:protein SCO1/2